MGIILFWRLLQQVLEGINLLQTLLGNGVLKDGEGFFYLIADLEFKKSAVKVKQIIVKFFYVKQLIFSLAE
ncbi:MAG: hypothetical protein MRZ79_15310 [Bacteroidia bacterium]|nr:hypothetical protein [Bacteroidia bacterium]